MNGLDNILRRIREDAQREMDAMEREAGEKADAILAKGREQAESLLTEGRQKNAALAESRKSRLVSAANMESRQTLLFTKQKCMEEVFHQAYQQIEGLSGEAYAEYLAKWIAGASETGDEEILLSAADREALGPRILTRANALREGASFTLAEDTREIRGAILRRGNVEINGSLDYRFRLLREHMATQVAQVLFQ